MKQKLRRDAPSWWICAATWQARFGQFMRSHAVLLLTGALLLVLSLHFDVAKSGCSVVSANLVKQVINKTESSNLVKQVTGAAESATDLVKNVTVKAVKGPAESIQQAAALTALKQGLFAQLYAAYRSRMVSFKGHTLLITVPAYDEYVGHEIYLSGQPYQSKLLGVMMDLIVPGSTVVDVGGNLGSFTAFFAVATGLEGRVYSFEPQNKMFQLICANAVNNGLTQVYPQNAALSFMADQLHMRVDVPDGTSTKINIHDAEKAKKLINYGGMMLGKGGEEVQSRTLDSYNLTAVSLIKIDAQGAEPLVMYGGRETIKKNLPVVVYEVVEGFGLSPDMIDTMHIPKEVQTFNMSSYLQGLGYKPLPQQPSHEDIVWLPPNHPKAKAGRQLLF